jgi:hypothetical protein
MIDNEIHHQLHATLAQLRDQFINVGQGAIPMVDFLVIRNVIAHIHLRAFVYYNRIRKSANQGERAAYWEIPKPRRLEPSAVRIVYHLMVEVFALRASKQLQIVQHLNDASNITITITICVSKGSRIDLQLVNLRRKWS